MEHAAPAEVWINSVRYMARWDVTFLLVISWSYCKRFKALKWNNVFDLI